jgi:hypothetical protein
MVLKNQNSKNMPVLEEYYLNLSQVNQRFLRNRRRSIRNDPNIKRQASLARRLASYKAKSE